jgi:hypothetical protein
MRNGDRKEFSEKTKRLAWERCHVDGVPSCEGTVNGKRCGLPLRPGRFTFDHDNPDYFSKDNSLENCKVLGYCCDKPKTAQDQKQIAKVRRLQRREAGMRPKGKGFRGWRTFSGEVRWKR